MQPCGPPSSPAQVQTLLLAHASWVRELQERGVFHLGEPLEPEALLLRKIGSVTRVAALARVDDRIGAFLLIDALDLQAAVAIAKQCPLLSHGDTIEVRPLWDPEADR